MEIFLFTLLRLFLRIHLSHVIRRKKPDDESSRKREGRELFDSNDKNRERPSVCVQVKEEACCMSQLSETHSRSKRKIRRGEREHHTVYIWGHSNVNFAFSPKERDRINIYIQGSAVWLFTKLYPAKSKGSFLFYNRNNDNHCPCLSLCV